jgi:hypothetical protein
LPGAADDGFTAPEGGKLRTHGIGTTLEDVELNASDA